MRSKITRQTFSLLFLAIFFTNLCKVFLTCDTNDHAVAQLSGDYIIGGIFPFHEGVSTLLSRRFSDDFECSGYQYNVQKLNERINLYPDNITTLSEHRTRWIIMCLLRESPPTLSVIGAKTAIKLSTIVTQGVKNYLYCVNITRKLKLENFLSWEYLFKWLQLRSVIEALSMIYTIENINNSTLLPGIKLGYEIYDSCSDGLKATQETLKLISNSVIMNSSEYCNNTVLIPNTKAVIGEIYSELSIITSRILSLHLIPQISPASSAITLLDSLRFPSLLCTVPNDKYQTEAIVSLIRRYEWNWVGILVTDDDYGRSALSSLDFLFKKYGICTAFSKTIPAFVDHPSVGNTLKEIIGELINSSTNTVIVFVKSPIVRKLFERAIPLNISKTWIASDIWAYSKEVASIPNIKKIGTIIGLNFLSETVPGFAHYLQHLNPSENGSTNEFLKKYKELRFGCTEDYRKYKTCMKSFSDNCLTDESLLLKSPRACHDNITNVYMENDDFLLQNIEWSTVYSTTLAVTATAQAIRNIVCKHDTCDKDNAFTHKTLLEEIKRGNYSFYDKTFYFEPSGDVLTGYDIICWNTTNNTVQFQVIGQYYIHGQKLTIEENYISWNTENNTVPFSNCSKACDPGTYKKHSDITCCYDCVPCGEGYYAPTSDMSQCLKCKSNQWSSNGSAECKNRTKEYFHWKNPLAITLMIFSGTGFLLVSVIGFLFLKYIDTPAVKAAGSNYTHILNIALLVNLADTALFIGEPIDIICQIRQPLYGISFTVIVSCILIKSLRIILAFESGRRHEKVMAYAFKPLVIILFLTCIQLAICLLWLLLKSPFASSIDHIPQLLIQQCDEGSNLVFGIMLGYIGLLAFICFLLAYKGRKLPQKYNEARFITFSMLVYMFVWIFFIPIYMNNVNSTYLSAIQIIAILASNYGVIACHLLPVCYIILFKSETNNREWYLQGIHDFFKARRSTFFPSQRISNFHGLEAEAKYKGTSVQIRRRHRSC